jgi:Spy/CpxP family protein refolding chaperone
MEQGGSDMRRRSLVALALVALVGSAGAALAQDTQPKPAPHRGMARLQQKLGLTDDQVTAIRAAYQRHAEEQKQARQALRAAEADLRQLALDGGDAAALQAKTAEVQRLLGQTVELRVKVLREIGPILTPEQRAKFAQAQLRPGMRHHRRAPVQS